MAFLEATHRLVLSLPTSPISTEPKLLAEFRHWMWTQRGTTEATLNTYRLPLIDLLHTLGDQPDQYAAKALRNFILEQANRWGIARAKTMVTAIRMFLRFLSATGRCIPGLDHVCQEVGDGITLDHLTMPDPTFTLTSVSGNMERNARGGSA